MAGVLDCNAATGAHLFTLGDEAGGDHPQGALPRAVVQPHIGVAGDVVERIPHRHHGLESAIHQAHLNILTAQSVHSALCIPRP